MHEGFFVADASAAQVCEFSGEFYVQLLGTPIKLPPPPLIRMKSQLET
jgi:hypothetical protein